MQAKKRPAEPSAKGKAASKSSESGPAKRGRGRPKGSVKKNGASKKPAAKGGRKSRKKDSSDDENDVSSSSSEEADGDDGDIGEENDENESGSDA